MTTEASPPPLYLETKHQVMYFDTDCGRVVHNLAYLRIIEECRTKLAMQLGANFIEMERDGLFSVVVRHEVDYVYPAVFGDTIITHGWLDSVERSCMWFGMELRKEQHDPTAPAVIYVRARQKVAFVRMPHGRPTRVPEIFRDLKIIC